MTQLTLDRPGNYHHVRSVGPEGIRIGEDTHGEALILSAETLITDWPPQRLEAVEENHWEAVLALKPEVVLVGTGKTQHFPHPSLLAPFYRAGVGIEVMTTEAACRTFNVLASEDRRVVAALLPIAD